MTQLLEQISKLSLEEKIVLVEKIWDDIADSSDAQEMVISSELEVELERRYQLLKEGKTGLHSWEDIEKSLLSGYTIWRMPTYSLQFTDEARQDIVDGFSWFEDKRKGLGLDFLLFLRAALNTIEKNPYLHQPISSKKAHIRRAIVHKFNYTIFYTVEKEDISVFGVLSSKQDPAIWKKRLKFW